MSLNPIPDLIPHTATPLDALLTRAAYAPLPNVGWIRVTGDDRVRWLNGMVTNNIAALKPGEGCYNFFLNAQGRIQGDCTAWMQEDSILLETAADRVPSLMELLDRFIIMDDVELMPLEHRAGLLLCGPDAWSSIAHIDMSSQKQEGMKLAHVTWHNATVDLIHAHGASVPQIELWSDAATVGLLTESLKSAGAVEAFPEALEQLRILSGTPLYGIDIRNSDSAKDLPQETNQTRALHFAKGCYLGQEIVERIRSRGQVHRTLTGFILTGDPATPGTILTAEAKPIGELTSVTTINSQQIALGYIRREALDRGAGISYPGGSATPVTLPFQLTESRPDHA